MVMTAACPLKRPSLGRYISNALWRLRLLFAAHDPLRLQREEVNAQAVRMLDTYGNSILRLAYSYLHNQSDAEEVLQDTLLQMLRAAPVLETPQHEKAWLLRVAANLSKNRLKYNRLRDSDVVWEAVKALPQHTRAAIHLFYHEGCSTAQIASILERKESTVRSDLRRGRMQLKEILKEAYDFGPEL